MKRLNFVVGVTKKPKEVRKMAMPWKKKPEEKSEPEDKKPEPFDSDAESPPIEGTGTMTSPGITYPQTPAQLTELLSKVVIKRFRDAVESEEFLVKITEATKRVSLPKGDSFTFSYEVKVSSEAIEALRDAIGE